MKNTTTTNPIKIVLAAFAAVTFVYWYNIHATAIVFALFIFLALLSIILK